MMLAMKLISLAFDLDSGAVRELPGIWDYAGYVLHVGSVIFGPWISYQDYAALLNAPEERIFVTISCYSLQLFRLFRAFAY